MAKGVVAAEETTTPPRGAATKRGTNKKTKPTCKGTHTQLMIPLKCDSLRVPCDLTRFVRYQKKTPDISSYTNILYIWNIQNVARDLFSYISDYLVIL